MPFGFIAFLFSSSFFFSLSLVSGKVPPGGRGRGGRGRGRGRGGRGGR